MMMVAVVGSSVSLLPRDNVQKFVHFLSYASVPSLLTVAILQICAPLLQLHQCGCSASTSTSTAVSTTYYDSAAASTANCHNQQLLLPTTTITNMYPMLFLQLLYLHHWHYYHQHCFHCNYCYQVVVVVVVVVLVAAAVARLAGVVVGWYGC